jgi:hypothetical protein
MGRPGGDNPSRHSEKEHAVTFDPGSVTLAYVHQNVEAHSFGDSLVNLLVQDMATEQRIMRGGYIGIRGGTDGLPEARNLAVRRFLEGKDAEWLFWVDTDMGFAPDALERLLAVADPNDAPIVGALCFAQKETDRDGMSGYRCHPRVTIMDWVETPEGSTFMGRHRWPVGSVVRCSGTGSACIVIHRTVLEEVQAKFGTWYDRQRTGDGRLAGEDLSFCMRAAACGFPVHVHTGVRTSHLKNLWLSEADYWADYLAPPAAERVAVLVPVLGRPQNAEPFMRALRASTGLATAYALVGPEETAKATCASEAAWRAAGAEVITSSSAVSFAEKVNLGYAKTSEPWLFLTGDDVRFWPGWLDHAQHMASWTSRIYDVIGTNDLGNPRVLAGEHATHLLIRRSYIDAQGGGWDGPGVLAHEGYRHWYVDDEIVTAARQRDAWVMALGSKVEHLHPAWGKADRDAVYDLGEASARADHALFIERLEAHRDA